MIAIANNIREMIEIRKFATQMEEVLSVEVDKSRSSGNYITREEAKKHNLKMPEQDDEHDEL